MTHVFKGQVKIEDVKNEFDYLVNSINALVDKYNTAANSVNFSIDTGSPALAPEGYTLSIGALKKIIDAYDGYTIGAHIFKVYEIYVVTAGVAFRNGHVVKLPQATLPYSPTGLYLEYNVSENKYHLDAVKTDTADTICVRAIHPYRDNIIMDNNLLPTIHPTLKVFSGDAEYSQYTTILPDVQQEQFYTAMMGEVEHPNSVWLLGKLLSDTWRTTSHNGKIFQGANKLFKPKGIGDLFTFANEKIWQNIRVPFAVIKRI